MRSLGSVSKRYPYLLHSGLRDMASVDTMDVDGASSNGLSRDEMIGFHVRRRVMGSTGWSWVRGGAEGAIGAPTLTGQYEPVRRAKSIPEILTNSPYPAVATAWPSGRSTCSEALSGQCPAPVEGAQGRPAAVLRLLGQSKPPLPAELRPWGIGSAPLPPALGGAGAGSHGYALLRTASGSCHLGQAGAPPAQSGAFPPPPLRRTVSCVCEVGGGSCGSCSCVRRQHASWVADVGPLQPDFIHTQCSVESTKPQEGAEQEQQQQLLQEEQQGYCARISDGAVDMCVDIDVDADGDPTSPPAQPAAAPPEPPTLLHLPPPAIPHLQATTASVPQLYRQPHPHPPARFHHHPTQQGAAAAGVFLPAHHLQPHNPQPSSSELLPSQPTVPDWPMPRALVTAAGPGPMGLGLLPLPSSLPFPSPSPSRGARQRSVGLTRKRQPEPQTVA